MIPAPWAFAILAFGAYRLTRLIGWDDWPPIARLRARVLGEEWVPTASPPRESQFPQPTMAEIGSGEIVSLPGKTPESEVAELRLAYRRPTLAHLVHCPFCVGWWISLVAYTGWLISARWTLLALAPFALSAVVGLVARNLD